MPELTEEEAKVIVAQHEREHAEFLARPLGRYGWIKLLQACQNGEASCGYVYEKIEADHDRVFNTLKELSEKIHSGYDFNADPQMITYCVGQILRGED